MSIENSHFFFTKHMANDDFSEALRRADSKNRIFFFFFFAEFWVRLTSGVQGSVLAGFSGAVN